MPALSFGLNGPKTKAALPKGPPKRKNLFDDEDDGDSAPTNTNRSGEALTALGGLDDDASPRPRKSPKLSHAPHPKNGSQPVKYTNLAALHSAKLQDAKASMVDSSVYDYDGVYDTFHVPKAASSQNENGAGAKYMNSLLTSADVRKRDQLRAKEKMLQKERENEGDEFADKEKFVTDAYKKQQEEIKRMEEEEAKKEAAEEERRKQGGGMTGWHREILKKEEERMRLIEQAAEEAAKNPRPTPQTDDMPNDERTDEKVAAELNEKGAHIVVNDDGEVVDKRQLLSAGLNVAKRTANPSNQPEKGAASASRNTGFRGSITAPSARHSQRERQTQMLQAQIEEMAEKARLAEEEAQNREREKVQSSKTEADKLGARERYLARKREREEEARRAKEQDG